MGVRLTDKDKAALRKAVGLIEEKSRIEVVVSVRRSARAWLAVPLTACLVAACGLLGVMMFSPIVFSWWALWLDPFLVGLLVALFIELLPACKRWCVPKAWRIAAVREQASHLFLQHGIHRTTGRSGVLVHFALLERVAVIIADDGVADAWALPNRFAAEDALSTALADGPQSAARVLESLAPELGSVMPRLGNDQNELADELDIKTTRAGHTWRPWR